MPIGTTNYPASIDSLATLIRPKDQAQTALSQDITASATTIPVASTASLDASGAVTIAGEHVTYAGKTAGSLTGCLRGQFVADGGSPAAAHGSGVAVEQLVIAAYHRVHSDAIIAAETKLGTGASVPAAGQVLKGTGAGAAGWSALVAGDVTTALGFAPLSGAGGTLTGALAIDDGAGDPAASGAVRLRNAAAVAARNAAGTADVGLVALTAADLLSLRDGTATLSASGALTATTFSGTTVAAAGNVSGASVTSGTNAAATGAVRIPNASPIKARNSGNTADLDLVQATAAGAVLVGPAGGLTVAADGGVAAGGALAVGGALTATAGATLGTPTIASFANAAHGHANAAGGGTLAAAAIGSGTMAPARLGSGVATAATVLRGDSTWGGARIAGRFDVRDHGAVGDGVADDTAAISAAIAAAEAAGGGVVFLPAGRYARSSTIALTNSRVSFAGVGTSRTDGWNGIDAGGAVSAILWTGGAAPVFDLSYVKGTSFRGFAIDGGGVATHGFRIDRANYCTFEDLYVARCATYGFYTFSNQRFATDDCRYNAFSHITVWDCPTCMALDGAPGETSNTSHNSFSNLFLSAIGATTALDLISCDNNMFSQVITSRPSGAGLGVRLRQHAYSNVFVHLEAGGGLQADAGSDNVIRGYDRANGQAGPTVAAGARLTWDEMSNNGTGFHVNRRLELLEDGGGHTELLRLRNRDAAGKGGSFIRWVQGGSDADAASIHGYFDATYGFALGFAIAGSERMWVHNDAVRIGQPVVLGSGGATIQGVLSGTAAWDPASVAVNASVQTTVTVAGAAVGDPCFVGFTTLTTQKLMLHAAVSAANTVTVTLNNDNAAAIDLASGTLRVVVFRL